jgi:surface protein
MFTNAHAFNQNIASWDTSNVESMKAMFSNAYAFNQNINSWDTSNVVDMLGMFSRTQSFNQSLNNWIVNNVTDFGFMFTSNTVFNQNLSVWNIKTDARLLKMFINASSFSQVLTGSWMSHTGDQTEMFDGTNGAKIYIPYRPETKSELQTAINEWITDVSTALSDYGYITLWNTEVITDMSELFLNANNFNDDISNWDVSNVTDFSSMFNGATNFDQNLTTWNIQQNATLNKMFFNASSFSQTLSGMWEDHTGDRTMMFDGTNGAYIPSPEIIDISFNWGTNIYKSTPAIDGEITVTTRDIDTTDIIKVTIQDPLANTYEYTAPAIENPLTIQIVNTNAFSDEGTYTVVVHAEDSTGVISNIFTTYFLVSTVATIENAIPQFENANSNIDEILYLYDIVSDGSIIVYSKGIEEGQPINVDITDSSSNLIYSYSGNVAPTDMRYFTGDVSSPNLSSITIPKSDLMKRQIMMNQELIGKSLYVVASSQDICGNTSTFTSEIKVEKTAEWAGSFQDAVDISSDLHVLGNVIVYEDISTNNITIHNYKFPLDRIREQKVLSTTSDGTELEWATKAKLGKLFEVVTCDISTAEANESTGENNFYPSIFNILLS